jgi:hypothetical protein
VKAIENIVSDFSWWEVIEGDGEQLGNHLNNPAWTKNENKKYDNSTHKTTNAKTKNTEDNTYEANIPIYIACCNGTRCDDGWRGTRAPARGRPAHQPIELWSAASRLANVRPFDFTGLHDICLADGSVVTGIVEGHLVQRISANGDFSLTFDEVLSYNGGTLGYRGEGSLTGDNWQSNVMTVGLGTGPLAGIHGQGTFVFTGPASLTDVIYYVYTPWRGG